MEENNINFNDNSDENLKENPENISENNSEEILSEEKIEETEEINNLEEIENIEEPIELQEEIKEPIEEPIEEPIATEEEPKPDNKVTVRPIKFQEFENVEVKRSIKKNFDILQDIPMHISVELGRAKSTIKEAMDLEHGSIVELNKIAGEQVEVFVNGKYIAKGEVIVIEDKFGVRITSTNIVKVEK